MGVLKNAKGPLHVSLGEYRTLFYEGQRVVLANSKIKERILVEVHASPYSIHPGSTKMYRDVKYVCKLDFVILIVFGLIEFYVGCVSIKTSS